MTELVNTNTGELVQTSSAREQVGALVNNAPTIFSTFKGDTQESKVALFTAVTDADTIADHLGEAINLVHVIAQVVEVENQDGQMVEAVRVVLVDADGTAYAGLSDGLFRSIQNLFGIVGMPDTWSAPLPVKVVEARSRKGFRFYTMKIA